MKKIIILVFAVVFSVQSFGQREQSITWLKNQDLTVTRYFIYKGDTLSFTQDYVYKTDSNSIFVTPKQLNDSLNALPGGHDEATVSTTGANSGLSQTSQVFTLRRATSSESGALYPTDYTLFYNKLGAVSHNAMFTGTGTFSYPLKIDTTNYVPTKYFVSENYLLQSDFDFDDILNKPTIPVISNDVYSAGWNGEVNDAASKDAIYDAIQSAVGSGNTNLSQQIYTDSIKILSDTGSDVVIAAGSTVNPSLMLAEDKNILDSIYGLSFDINEIMGNDSVSTHQLIVPSIIINDSINVSNVVNISDATNSGSGLNITNQSSGGETSSMNAYFFGSGPSADFYFTNSNSLGTTGVNNFRFNGTVNTYNSINATDTITGGLMITENTATQAFELPPYGQVDTMISDAISNSTLDTTQIEGLTEFVQENEVQGLDEVIEIGDSTNRPVYVNEITTKRQLMKTNDLDTTSASPLVINSAYDIHSGVSNYDGNLTLRIDSLKDGAMGTIDLDCSVDVDSIIIEGWGGAGDGTNYEEIPGSSTSPDPGNESVVISYRVFDNLLRYIIWTDNTSTSSGVGTDDQTLDEVVAEGGITNRDMDVGKITTKKQLMDKDDFGVTSTSQIVVDGSYDYHSGVSSYTGNLTLRLDSLEDGSMGTIYVECGVGVDSIVFEGWSGAGNGTNYTEKLQQPISTIPDPSGASIIIAYFTDGTQLNYLMSGNGELSSTGNALTQEQVEDYVGGMFTGNIETLITGTYQDVDGTIDLVVDDDLSNYDNSISNFAPLGTGTDNQVPVMNIGGTGYDYSPNFIFNGTELLLGGIVDQGIFGFQSNYGAYIKDGMTVEGLIEGENINLESTFPYLGVWDTDGIKRYRVRSNVDTFLIENYSDSRPLFSLIPSGAAKFNQYGSGTFTGTPTQIAGFDNSHNLIEIASIDTTFLNNSQMVTMIENYSSSISTSELVPYTGASSNLDLGTYDLFTDRVSSYAYADEGGTTYLQMIGNRIALQKHLGFVSNVPASPNEGDFWFNSSSGFWFRYGSTNHQLVTYPGTYHNGGIVTAASSSSIQTDADFLWDGDEMFVGTTTDNGNYSMFVGTQATENGSAYFEGKVEFSSGIIAPIRLVSTARSYSDDDYTYINTAAGASNPIYMLESPVEGRICVIVNRSSEAMTVKNYNNTATITYYTFSGTATTVPAESSVTLQYDGSNWYQIQ